MRLDQRRQFFLLQAFIGWRRRTLRHPGHQHRPGHQVQLLHRLLPPRHPRLQPAAHGTVPLGPPRPQKLLQDLNRRECQRPAAA